MKLPVDYEALSPSEKRVVRKEYMRLQKYACHHCNESLNGPPSAEVLAARVDKSLFPVDFFKWPVHLHHSHATGMTIGAVHNYCNAVLWQYHGE